MLFLKEELKHGLQPASFLIIYVASTRCEVVEVDGYNIALKRINFLILNPGKTEIIVFGPKNLRDYPTTQLLWMASP